MAAVVTAPPPQCVLCHKDQERKERNKKERLHWILFEIHTFLKVNKISLKPSINSSFIFQEIQKNFICFLHASFRLEISHNNSYNIYLVTDFSHHLLWRPESLRVIRNWFLETIFLLISWNYYLLISFKFSLSSPVASYLN